MDKTFPDISEILSAKARRRRALEALSWEEKVAIVEQMQTLLPRGQWKDRTRDDLASDQRLVAPSNDALVETP
jgi:hypothetical protein